ncbi:MAG: thioredoxin family protein [Candidatus Micrarchaeota archaeon]
MKIQIYGPGCRRCLTLENHVKDAVEKSGIKAEIGHVFDVNKMVDAGVISTPSLAINGKIVSQGKVLETEEIIALLKK